jgi:4-amino-4-deoxy-L-arabinose transferase-like glycosyltransferase
VSRIPVPLAAPAAGRSPGRRLAGTLALNPTGAAVAVIGLATLARILADAVTGLSVDESYAVSVARTLSLSYFDHPPLSFWLPAVLAKLAGTEAGLLLRAPFILLFAGTSWMMFRLTARLFGERAGFLAVLLLSVAPVFSFSTGGWVLPDGPLMFCLLGAALCLERVLLAEQMNEAHAWRWWLGAGLFTGLALLSKYHGAFMVLGALAFVLTSARARPWLRRPQPYVAAAVALAVFAPALIWNMQHDWISLRFQGGRGAPAGGIHWLDLLRSLGGQAAYLLPWIWLPAAWELARALLGGPRHPRQWFLGCLAAGPVVFFTLPALGGHPGLPHWEAPGWLFTFPLLGALADAGLARRPRATRAWLAGAVAGYAVIWVLGVSQMATGWAARVAPSLLSRGDPSWEVVNWSDLGSALAARQLPGANDFVAATRWMDAGKVAYALGPGVAVVCLCEHPHHFHFVSPQDHFLGRDAVLVLPPDADPAAIGALAPHFRSLEPLGDVLVHRAGRAEFRLPLYLGHDFTRPVAIDLPR